MSKLVITLPDAEVVQRYLTTKNRKHLVDQILQLLEAAIGIAQSSITVEWRE